MNEEELETAVNSTYQQLKALKTEMPRNIHLYGTDTPTLVKFLNRLGNRFIESDDGQNFIPTIFIGYDPSQRGNIDVGYCLNNPTAPGISWLSS